MSKLRFFLLLASISGSFTAAAVQVAWYEKGGVEKYAVAVNAKNVALRTPQGTFHQPVAACNQKAVTALKQRIDRFAKTLPRQPKARAHAAGLAVDSVRRAVKPGRPATNYFKNLDREVKTVLVQSSRLCKGPRKPANAGELDEEQELNLLRTVDGQLDEGTLPALENP